MEKQFQLTVNGQQVQQQDFNTLGQVSGLADDRVFAELFRMTPFNGSTATKGILPFAHQTSARTALVAPNGATGSVVVEPFRAFVSSRTTVLTDARANWRDVRSGLSVAEGAAALTQSVSLAANSSGSPRWDLVYAAVTVDANSSAEARKFKDPSTKIIASVSVVLTKVTSVSLGVVAGTAAASPVFPAVPADSASTYYVPLAYVRVPNGFSATSTVGTSDICMAAPVLSLSRASGAANIQVANQQYAAGGVVVSTAKQQSWGSSGTRPVAYVPSTMGGGETLVVALDLRTGSQSHVSGGVVDDRDWRGRLCMTSIAIRASNASKFPWDPSVISVVPAGNVSNTHADSLLVVMGQTMFVDDGGTGSIVALADSGSMPAWLPGTSTVQFYVDHGDSGKLKVSYTNSPDRIVLAFIQFTAPFENA